MAVVVKPMRTHWDSAALDTMFRMRRLGASWEQIADQLPDRTADAVRLEYHRRWTPELEATLPAPDPAIRASHAPCARVFWTAEEDNKILNGLKLHGKHWRKILATLPGRSDSSVRNRAKRLLQEQAAAVAGDAPVVSARSVSVGSGLAADASVATPRPAERMLFSPLARSASISLAELMPGVEELVTMDDDAGLAADPLTPSPRRGTVTFEPSAVAAREEAPARLSYPREVADDGRRSRLDDLSDRRSRNESRRDESELDEMSLTSALDELSASLKSLGLITGYKGRGDIGASGPREISLDELECFAREAVAV